jgi:flagellar basal body-associated protein FliL
MYEMERVIVNLRQVAEGEHIPMGLFEFYIATNSQDATVEIGDRRTEARHIIERVIEQMTYEDLVSPQGKGKLKFIVRKQLNDFLTKSHHVKQVYIKTFVLKP